MVCRTVRAIGLSDCSEAATKLLLLPLLLLLILQRLTERTCQSRRSHADACML